MTAKDFILASGSPQRKALLEIIHFTPKAIIPADIDESPKKGEKPTAYVKRMALEKAQFVATQHPGEVVLASDSIGVLGTELIRKAHTPEEQTQMMRRLSGRTHKVLTSVCVIDKQGHISLRVNSNKIFMKKMTEQEIEDYVKTNEWVGVACYQIEGAVQTYVKKIIGSYSGIIGLPLYEARCMLIGAGIK